MRSAVMLAGLALVLVLSRVGAADNSTPQVRVRKELRNLNNTELELFVTGLSIMLAIDTEHGQAMYGQHYREYNFFINLHALAVNDPRGDQGHAGACFMTFHRALALGFELSLLSIVPQLGAMPYWDVLKDVRGGAYNTSNPKYMFSKNYAGALTGDPSQNYTVTDGIFGVHPIDHYSWAKYGSDSKVYNGSLTTGLLRSPGNNNTNIYLTRYPYNTQIPYNTSLYVPDIQPNEFPVNYKEEDFTRCFDPVLVKTWMDWTNCVDLVWLIRQNAVANISRILSETRSPLLHTAPHTSVGGMLSGTVGDFHDVATSPNEVLLFMIHHANVDRSNMIWQQASATADPSLATWEVLWNYPVNKTQYTDGMDGCFLHDVINSLEPFTHLFPATLQEKPQGYTHADVLWNTRPGVSPYTYDNMYTDIVPAGKRLAQRRLLSKRML